MIEDGPTMCNTNAGRPEVFVPRRATKVALHFVLCGEDIVWKFCIDAQYLSPACALRKSCAVMRTHPEPFLVMRGGSGTTQRQQDTAEKSGLTWVLLHRWRTCKFDYSLKNMAREGEKEGEREAQDGSAQSRLVLRILCLWGIQRLRPISSTGRFLAEFSRNPQHPSIFGTIISLDVSFTLMRSDYGCCPHRCCLCGDSGCSLAMLVKTLTFL